MTVRLVNILAVPLCGLLLLQACSQVKPEISSALETAIKSSLRTESYSQRDVYRHPAETLLFFDVQPNHHVVEIWPGGGWYTEILAPYLNERGQFYAAHFPENSPVVYFSRGRDRFLDKLTSSPELYERVHVAEFHPPSSVVMAKPESIDRVLTFRNVHNWLKAGYAEAAFKEFYSVLKPGGVLGVVEHRAPAGRSVKDMIKSGYMTEAKVVALAKSAGFVLEASSGINANVKDTTEHPAGVWSLPPTLRLGEQDREKYLATGESDRMTLKFVKP